MIYSEMLSSFFINEIDNSQTEPKQMKSVELVFNNQEPRLVCMLVYYPHVKELVMKVFYSFLSRFYRKTAFYVS